MSLRPSSYRRSTGNLDTSDNKNNVRMLLSSVDDPEDDDDRDNDDHDHNDLDDDDDHHHHGSQAADGAADAAAAAAAVVEKEDPLLLAMDDLEGRVVAAIDDVKLHPGTRTGMIMGTTVAASIHDELAMLLRPVLEVAAHTGPSIARTYYPPGGSGFNMYDGLEAAVEDVYQRVVSDLVLPVILEVAQSDTVPAKRVAALEWLRHFWNECHKAGSWLDATNVGLSGGPYGPGGSSSESLGGASGAGSVGGPGGGPAGTAGVEASTPAARAALKRRRLKRLAREGEILRYWVQAAMACIVPGVFTRDAADGAVASRGMLAASAALRPSLRHMAQRIKDADDRGANRLYGPLMKLMQGVVRRLFVSTSGGSSTNDGSGSGGDDGADAVRSACIKFLEIVILCCSRKPSNDASLARRRGQSSMEDFSLDDLPAGHPIITREALEAIAEYAFTTLRGLTLIGGQVKIDVNLLSDMMLAGDGSPSDQVVSILKPAALAYLEIESTLPKTNDNSNALDYELDRANIELDFALSQKSYTLVINAMATLAIHRPVFFQEAAITVARRAVQPPVVMLEQQQQQQQHALNKAAVLVITSHLKATCLTLLRNALSVTTNAWEILHQALKRFDMELQADKALHMARQATALKTAGRAARYRANMYYEWDASEGGGSGGGADASGRLSKRQRETDDALAKLRAAKAARGLGNGIQLPTSMTDAVELVLINLSHLPSTRPSTTTSAAGTTSKKQRTAPITLDFVVDAVMTNGVSLSQEEGRWYDRDGGAAWSVDMNAEKQLHYELEGKLLETLESINVHEQDSSAKDDNEVNKRRKLFHDQCHTAAADALSRIVRNAAYHRSKSLADLGNQIAARLAFTLEGIKRSSNEKAAFDMAKRSAEMACEVVGNDLLSKESLQNFVDSYPMVASSLALEATASADPNELTAVKCSISGRMMHEAMLQTFESTKENRNELYDHSLDILVASAVCAGKRAHEKPSDSDRKRAAVRSAANLQREIVKLPRLTKTSLLLISAMCDIEDIKKKAAETARKTSQDSIAASAAAHAAMVAAEKRATAALLILRDAAFQFDTYGIRKCAVECAVSIASGRLPSIAGIQDKALKLVMNVFYAKNETFASLVVEATTKELKFFSDLAVEAYDAIETANKLHEKDEQQKQNPFLPQSDEEKAMMERLRKPALLFMALCMRRPDSIEDLFKLCSVDKAAVLSKTVRVNISKLARAAAAKHGAATIALKIADMSGEKETPMLLSFLENLAPTDRNAAAEEDIIAACIKIQESKLDEHGKKDPRYIIPVVSIMKRNDLANRLPEFVAAEDKIFLAALVRMGDRQQRQALLFRDEPDEENPSLVGMTLCEQLVYLHKLDFSSAGLPQKRYLAAIKLCLEDDEVYNDRVLMSALDHLSGTFLTGKESLPLAFMRTVILTCTKHESLHSWICHVLLPRLVEGKIYSDPRQWEGWMRCAHMLEKSGDEGVNSLDAIQKLPPDQLMQYQTKWAGK